MQSLGLRRVSSRAEATERSNLPELQKTPSGRRRGSRQGASTTTGCQASNVIRSGFELSVFGNSTRAVSVDDDALRMRRHAISCPSDLTDESCNPGGTAMVS